MTETATAAHAEPDLQPDDPLVVYAVCRTDLGMSPGKLGAQMMHAFDGLRDLVSDELMSAYHADPRRPKIALRASSHAKFDKALRAAHDAGIPAYLQVDAGLTEVAANTPTVFALGPVRRSQMTGALRRLQLL